MIEAAISIIDRLIQLGSLRERNRAKFFNNYIEPLYRDAEEIARDYSILFAELITRLAHGQEAKEVVLWLEERRRNLQPLRTKVRAILKTHPEYGTSTALDRFQRGIWGLMKGGISIVETGHAMLRNTGSATTPCWIFCCVYHITLDPASSTMRANSCMRSNVHGKTLPMHMQI